MFTRLKKTFVGSLAYSDLLLVGGGACILALASHMHFYLWFTPVPVTLQTLSILLMGAWMGSKRAPAAVALYLGLSQLHVPYFSGFLGGVTSGYLLGFVLAAYLVGLAFERKSRAHWGIDVLIFTLGALTVHLGGFLWLLTAFPAHKALEIGFYPFIWVDFAKIFLAASLTSFKWKNLFLST